jgi:putative transposase
MSRRRRQPSAGFVFHVVNRAAKRVPLFESGPDYVAFERALLDASNRFDVALLAYCLMPNHWHLVVLPRTKSLSRFMHWLTTTHARRWQSSRGTDGQGAVYQGRYKAIPVCADEHFLWICRYVERNALRAGLVERAEDWRWSSLWCREKNRDADGLCQWPIPLPEDWLVYVNTPQTEGEVEAIRLAMRNGQPFGDAAWQRHTLGLAGTKEPRRCGRPRRRYPGCVT